MDEALKNFKPHPYLPHVYHTTWNGMSIIRDGTGKWIPSLFEVMDRAGDIHRFNNWDDLVSFLRSTL